MVNDTIFAAEGNWTHQRVARVVTWTRNQRNAMILLELWCLWFLEFIDLLNARCQRSFLDNLHFEIIVGEKRSLSCTKICRVIEDNQLSGAENLKR